MQRFALITLAILCVSCERKAEWRAPQPSEPSIDEQTDGPSLENRYHPDVVEYYAPDRPKAIVRFEPLDLTTAVPADSPLRATVDNLGEAVGENTLRSLREHLKLYTWPDYEPVEAELVEHDVVLPQRNSTTGGDRQDLADIELRPKETLAERWYVLKIDGRLPTGVVAAQYGQHYRFADGTVGSRFAIGSDPRLVSIRACPKGEDKPYVVAIDFSELINPQAIRDGQIEVAVGEKSCAAAEDTDTDRIDSARFACADVNEPISVAVYGMRGVDGPTPNTGVKVSTMRTASALSDEGGAQGVEALRYQMVYAEMANWGDGCRIYRP